MDYAQQEKQRFVYLFIPIPFIFYWYTCLPSIGLGDSAMMVEQIKHLRLSTHVNTHNITILLGWLLHFLPLGDLAYRLNLVSVISGALCVSIFYLALYQIHRCWITAVITSLFLMLSHSLWWSTSCKQEHATNALFISLSLFLYGRLQKSNNPRYFYILFFLSGLAFFHHFELGCLVGGVSIALLWRFLFNKKYIWSTLWRCSLCFFIGFLPYFLLFIHDAVISHSFNATLSGALGGQFKKLYFQGGFWYGITNYLFLIFFQTPSAYLLTIILGPFFFFKSWRISES
ncbi:MAG: DUF2723 domain-containing protein, partial [Candidatus Omnitrophica bacterium]|nr:DUF2723 domain-containing protein [Candidatus Omnitrophota bacterium]